MGLILSPSVFFRFNKDVTKETNSHSVGLIMSPSVFSASTFFWGLSKRFCNHHLHFHLQGAISSFFDSKHSIRSWMRKQNQRFMIGSFCWVPSLDLITESPQKNLSDCTSNVSTYILQGILIANVFTSTVLSNCKRFQSQCSRFRSF